MASSSSRSSLYLKQNTVRCETVHILWGYFYSASVSDRKKKVLIPFLKECFPIHIVLPHRCGFPCKVCTLQKKINNYQFSQAVFCSKQTFLHWSFIVECQSGPLWSEVCTNLLTEMICMQICINVCAIGMFSCCCSLLIGNVH